FALGAVRALHADGLLLHVLALRIIAARHELAVAPVLFDQLVTALRTRLVQRNILGFLRRTELLRGLALGIARARQELTETALFEHHRTAAVVAVFLLVLLGDAFLLHFACVSALGVSGAGDETAVLAPLDHHGLAALLADEVGGPLHALDVGHVTG